MNLFFCLITSRSGKFFINPTVRNGLPDKIKGGNGPLPINNSIRYSLFNTFPPTFFKKGQKKKIFSCFRTALYRSKVLPRSAKTNLNIVFETYKQSDSILLGFYFFDKPEKQSAFYFCFVSDQPFVFPNRYSKVML